MKNVIKILTCCMLMCLNPTSYAQTAYSLFCISDSLQVSEVILQDSDCSDLVGHSGPAVENSHMALRLPLDGSGSVDVYSKSARGMELRQYLWNSTPGQQDTLQAGADGYAVMNTLGLGGVALWDSGQPVRLIPTRGYKAVVGETRKGAFAEVISYGVSYKGELVDVSVRIEMTDKSREAVIYATELSGRNVCFVTGVNFHPGQKVTLEDGVISVWGPHPVTDDARSFPIGAAMIYPVKAFPVVEKTEEMIMIVSKPMAQIRTNVLSASVKEAELNSARRFESYLLK